MINSNISFINCKQKQDNRFLQCILIYNHSQSQLYHLSISNLPVSYVEKAVQICRGHKYAIVIAI